MNTPPSESAFEMSLAACPTVDMVGTALAGSKSTFQSAVPGGLRWLHLFRYATEVVINGVSYQIEPGDMTLLAPGTTVGLRFPKHAVHYALYFHLPDAQAPPLYRFQMVNRLGNDYLPMSQMIEQIMVRRAVDANWANLTLWDLLFRLATRRISQTERPTALHPGLGAVVLVIEHQMMRQFSAADFAQMTGLSQTHLNRLFQATFQMSVMEYFRAQRMKQARKLLLETDIPISTIAEMVGVPQIQHFNKLIHKTFGMSPTRLREGESRNELPD